VVVLKYMAAPQPSSARLAGAAASAASVNENQAAAATPPRLTHIMQPMVFRFGLLPK
jgi:hypothetical protein